MNWFSSFIHRLKALWSREQLDRDLDDELAAHLALKQMSLERQGMNPAIASRQARHALGNPAVWKESTRESWMFTWLEEVWRDVVFGVRLLAKDKIFTLVALFTLAIGIGANTAIFSLINGLMFRELPVKDPEQLVRIRVTNLPPSEKTWVNGRVVKAKERQQISFPLFDAINRQQIFSEMFGTSGNTSVVLSYNGSPHEVTRTAVTGTYFQMLGVAPRIGRLLNQDDDIPGGPSTGWNIVISDALWARLFNRESTAIGTQVTVERIPFTIVGVAPAGFHGVRPDAPQDIWFPISTLEVMYPDSHWRRDADSWMIWTMARLRPEISFDHARNQIASMSPPLLSEIKPPNLGRDEKDFLAQKLDLVAARSGFSQIAETSGKTLWMLMAATGVILLIAATNLTNLLFARSTARQQEISVRIALGASARRIRRQLLIENFLLALTGALLGAILAQWLVTALIDHWMHVDAPFDWNVLAFISIVLIAVVLITSWAPVWLVSKTEVYGKEKNRTTSKGMLTVRSGLIVLQMTLSVVLLAGSGLLIASLRATLKESTGFHASQTLFITPDLFNAGVSKERLPRAYANVLEEVRRQPGVMAASWVMTAPLTGSLSGFTIETSGQNTVPRNSRMVFSHQITDAYFTTMGISLLAGHDFPPAASDHPICIVSESLARKFFGSVSGALGQQVTGGNLKNAEIIGIVSDTKYNHIREPAPMTVYSLYWNDNFKLGMTLAVRHNGQRESLLAALRKILEREAGRAPLTKISTIDENISTSMSNEKLLTGLLTAFAAFALLISAMGIAGLLSYSVQLRRKEIGIRMALGATPVLIRRQFQKHGVVLSIAGLLLGGLLSYWLRRTIDAYLFRTESGDPIVWIAVSALLLACATTAASIPAWKASRIDPMQTLRLD